MRVALRDVLRQKWSDPPSVLLIRLLVAQVAKYTASRPQSKDTLDRLEGTFLKLLESAKPTTEVSCLMFVLFTSAHALRVWLVRSVVCYAPGLSLRNVSFIFTTYLFMPGAGVVTLGPRRF